MGQVGIPLFPLQSMGGMGQLVYKDLFADGSIHNTWRTFLGELSSTGKSITESAGVLTIGCQSGYNAQWATSDNEAPRIFLGLISHPCEVITKVTAFSRNDYNRAGLFIAKSATTFGGSLHMSIAVKRKDTVPVNGIAVLLNDTEQATYTPDTTLPVWLRIRVYCTGYASLSVDFSYSYDGVNYTVLYTQKSGWSLFSLSPGNVGLYAANATGMNAVSGSFEYFLMRTIKGAN